MRLPETKLQSKPGFSNDMSSKFEEPLSLLAERKLTEHPDDNRASSRLHIFPSYCSLSINSFQRDAFIFWRWSQPPRHPLTSFVMGDIADDLGAIFAHLRDAAPTMQQGGGIRYDFSQSMR